VHEAAIAWPAQEGIFTGLSDPPQRQAVVALGLGLAFLIGHLVSYTLDPRPRPDRRPISTRTGAATRHWKRPTLSLVVVAVVLLGFLGLLLYEGIAISQDPKTIAISFYARCGDLIATYRTIGLAAAVTFTLGAWLRFRWKSEKA
jgi:hypothetical protein